jgi:hypothetical protein
MNVVNEESMKIHFATLKIRENGAGFAPSAPRVWSQSQFDSCGTKKNPRSANGQTGCD